jgi:phosphoglycerate dehydrogenase-like enzyme
MNRVLITGALPIEIGIQLEKLGLKLTLYGVNDLTDENKFLQTIKDIDIYIFGGYEIPNRTILEAANKLKLIVFIGTDCGSYIDLPFAKQKGITVCNTPGANAPSVAEFTVGLMLAAQRRISFAANTKDQAYGTYHTAMSKTLGLIGFGNIGSAVAKICSSGLNMQIRYWTRSGEKEEAQKLGAKFLNLDELLITSDFVSLHVPGAAGCLLDSEKFKKLNLAVL